MSKMLDNKKIMVTIVTKSVTTVTKNVNLLHVRLTIAFRP